MGSVYQHGVGVGTSLFAERITVVPDGAGVGARIGGGYSGHMSTLRSRYAQGPCPPITP